MVSIPFSKSKRYLTGIDWILHGFDCMNKRATGAGNAFQIVMELEGAPTEAEVRDSLDRFVGKFPALGGRTRRDYNLAPYWKIPSKTPRAALEITCRAPKLPAPSVFSCQAIVLSWYEDAKALLRKLRAQVQGSSG